MDEVHWSTRRRSISRPGFWQLSVTLCSTLIAVGAYLVIARTLDPQSFGIYTLVQWLASVALPMIGIGTSRRSSYQIIEILRRETGRQAAGIFHFLWYRQCWNILLYCGIYLALATLLARIYGALTSLFLLLAGLAAIPLLLSNIASIVLRSLRRSNLLAMLHLCSAISLLLFISIASQSNGEQVAAFLLASALASMLTLILAVVCAAKHLPLRNAIQPGFYMQRRILQSLKCSLLLFLLDFITWQHSELLLLACWRSPAEIGFYVLSACISVATMRIAPTFLFYWLLPLYLRYIPGKHFANTYDAFVKTSCAIVFLAVPICIIMMVACPFAIMACLGSAYLPVVKPLRILLIATAFGSAATISLTHLANEGNKREQQRLAAGVALLKIVLAVPLIGLWGMVGAALATAIAQIISATGSILLCNYLISKDA